MLSIINKEPQQMGNLKNWTDINANLSEPFNPHIVKFRVGSISYDKKSAKAFAFVDPREYQARLDDACGSANWKTEYRQLGDDGIICKITIRGICEDSGIVGNFQEEIGEFQANDQPRWMNASSQAFKRACASFGLGRYFYTLKERYYPLKDTNYSPQFADIEQVRVDMLMSSDVLPEQRRRVEEKIIKLMMQKFSVDKFYQPDISITEMNYLDLLEYGKFLKDL